MSDALIVTLSVFGILLGIFIIVMLPSLWFRALISGTYIPLFKLLRIRAKRLNARAIVTGYINARKSGVVVTLDQLENHVQARGDIEKVVAACIAAVNADIDLPVRTAMAIDLSGRDINQAVKDRVTPRIIETPKVTTVTRSGIEMSASAKITIRTNLKRLVGGAMEETIIARVCEGIVTCIGNALTHNELLEHPENISKRLTQDKNTAHDTAYDIVSIDISKIEVGRNIGAELIVDEAEAQKIIAIADAEQRRSAALASEQEMRAATQEMRAKVVEAEIRLPLALANALENGNISVQQFYQLENMLSDTQMRKKISGTSDMLPPPQKKSRLA